MLLVIVRDGRGFNNRYRILRRDDFNFTRNVSVRKPFLGKATGVVAKYSIEVVNLSI